MDQTIGETSEHDFDQRNALEEALAGVVAQRAQFEEFALELFVEALAPDKHSSIRGEPLRDILVRQARNHGPGETGWIDVLIKILGEYQQLLPSAGSWVGYNLLTNLELHGFGYATHPEAIACLNRMMRAIWKHIQTVRQGPLHAVILAHVGEDREAPNEGEYVLFTFAVLIHNIVASIGWECKRRMKNSQRVPLASPWVLGLVTELTLTSNHRLVLCGTCDRLHYDRVWKKVIKADMAGVTEEDVDRFLKTRTSSSLYAILSSFHRRKEDVEALRYLAMSPSQDPRKFIQIRTWFKLGRPGDLNRFLEAGGTKEAWETQLETRRAEQAEREAERKREEHARTLAKKATNAPNPHKRGSRGYTPEKPARVDFEALCSELDICTHFSDLDPVLTRIVLIHGLLRDGERLASVANSPQRNEKKLWGQCRGPINGSTSRRDFKGTLRKLVSAHLISFSGGSYQLAKPNSRFPQAHAVLTQLHGLVNKYS